LHLETSTGPALFRMSSHRTRTGFDAARVGQGQSMNYDGGGSFWGSRVTKQSELSMNQAGKMEGASLVEKQSDLESIYQKHDGLVCYHFIFCTMTF
jgi:hypothetical protein